MESRDTLELPAKGLRPSAHQHGTLQTKDTPIHSRRFLVYLFEIPWLL
jgi:hypothetical protein